MTLTVEDSDGTVTIRQADTTIARYRANTTASKPHFDVLTLPEGAGDFSGQNLVLVSPHEHAWHHGLFSCPKLVDGINCWASELFASQGRTYGFAENVRYDVDSRCDSIDIEQRLCWRSSEDERLLNESRKIRLFEPSAKSYFVTWTQTLRAAEQTRHLTGESFHGKYGGLCVRCIRSMAGGRILTPNATDPEPNENSPGQWCDVTGPLDGSRRIDETPTAGITLMCHPSLDRSTHGWFTRSEPYPLVTANPTWDAVTTLHEGDEITWRWGVWVHMHEPDRKDIESAFSTYCDLINS